MSNVIINLPSKTALKILEKNSSCYETTQTLKKIFNQIRKRIKFIIGWVNQTELNCSAIFLFFLSTPINKLNFQFFFVSLKLPQRRISESILAVRFIPKYGISHCNLHERIRPPSLPGERRNIRSTFTRVRGTKTTNAKHTSWVLRLYRDERSHNMLRQKNESGFRQWWNIFYPKLRPTTFIRDANKKIR